MYKWLIGFFALIALAVPFAQRGTEHAIAQGQVFCQTRPPGTSDNSCASTAFVQAAVGGGGSTTITNGTTNTSGFTDTYVLISTASKVGQVIGSTIVNGVTCALGGSCTIPSAGIANVSGSAQNTTGTISAASHTLTLALAKDFVNGQGIRVNHAGAAFTLNPPTGGVVTPEGTPGVTTYQYRIASLDANGGVGALIASFQTTTGSASLGYANFNLVAWTAPASGTAPSGYAVLKNISGTFTTVGIVANGEVYFEDRGYTAFPFIDWVPTTAWAGSLADALVTTISSGGGTTSLTLAGASTTAATTQGIYHDDGAAIQAALTAAGALSPPGTINFSNGTYYIATSTGLTVPQGVGIKGQLPNSIIQTVFPDESVFKWAPATGGNHISGLTFKLVPGAIGLDQNIAEVEWIDHILCLGGATGNSGTPTCISEVGTLQIDISHITLQEWDGAIGYGTGGIPPSISVVYTASNPSLEITMDTIIMFNYGAQVMIEQPTIQFDQCLNCTLTNSYLNAGWGETGAQVFGGVGVEWEGNSQSLAMTGDQILGYAHGFRADSATSGQPQTLNMTANHYDFCGSNCILLNAGFWIALTNNSFEGENQSPWNYVGNKGITLNSGFTVGPSVISNNTFHDFTSTGAFGILLGSSPANISIYGNQGFDVTTLISGSVGSGSVIGSTCAAGVPTAAFFTVNGVPGAC
jgi:hypothetical protein